MTISAGGGPTYSFNPTQTAFQEQTSASHDLKNQGAIGKGNVVILSQAEQNNISFTDIDKRNLLNYKAETGHPTLRPMEIHRGLNPENLAETRWEVHYDWIKKGLPEDIQKAVEELKTEEFSALRDALKRLAYAIAAQDKAFEYQQYERIVQRSREREKIVEELKENGKSLFKEVLNQAEKLLSTQTNSPQFLTLRELFTHLKVDRGYQMDQLMRRLKERPLLSYKVVEEFAKWNHTFQIENSTLPPLLSFYGNPLLSPPLLNLIAQFEERLVKESQVNLKPFLQAAFIAWVDFLEMSRSEDLIPKEDTHFDPAFRDELLLLMIIQSGYSTRFFEAIIPDIREEHLNLMEFLVILIGIFVYTLPNQTQAVTYFNTFSPILIPKLEFLLQSQHPLLQSWKPYLLQLHTHIEGKNHLELLKSYQEIFKGLNYPEAQLKQDVQTLQKRFYEIKQAYNASRTRQPTVLNIVG